MGSGSVEGVYVSPELIGIITATIALATTMLASLRSLRQEMRREIGSVRSELLGEIGRLRSELLGEIGSVRNELRGETGSIRSELRSEIGNVRSEVGSIRSELRETRSELRDEMQAGFKALHARMVNIGDRLSKVEGVIEGMFWSARNQPPDKPREGAA